MIDERFASKPSSIVMAVPPLLSDPQVLEALGMTLYAVGASFAIGTAGGMLVGVILGLQPMLRTAYFPIVMMLLGTPKSLFLPVIMLFFGLGVESAIVFGSILTFVHVTVNVVAGVDLVEPKHLMVAKAYRASRWKRFRHVILPGASPGLFTAIWHGLRNGFTGVVIAQLFTATAGIGYLVRVYSNNFQTDRALTLILMVSLVLILVGTGWNHVEKRLTSWRPDATQ
ncbi:ABC transporter permease [Blastococcus saxobsidens]|uniref:ABC transporter permease n=1 Tax=Blastococcus saxobsidens TaxID=138336 RepID=UPI0013EEA5DD|nr:ABC transporter permease subunit [Blastococcus saxobsidens]